MPRKLACIFLLQRLLGFGYSRSKESEVIKYSAIFLYSLQKIKTVVLKKQSQQQERPSEIMEFVFCFIRIWNHFNIN